MTTIESPQVNALWEAIHAREPKALMGGSVPNLETEQPHSYHRSWQNIAHDDGYSVHYWGDKHGLRGVTQYACAIDITLPEPALMVKYTARLHHAALTHPRFQLAWGVREIAGTLDNVNVAAWDTTNGVHQTFGWDSSHLYHIHISINRRLITSSRILRIASVFGP